MIEAPSMWDHHKKYLLTPTLPSSVNVQGEKMVTISLFFSQQDYDKT